MSSRSPTTWQQGKLHGIAAQQTHRYRGLPPYLQKMQRPPRFLVLTTWRQALKKICRRPRCCSLRVQQALQAAKSATVVPCFTFLALSVLAARRLERFAGFVCKKTPFLMDGCNAAHRVMRLSIFIALLH